MRRLWPRPSAVAVRRSTHLWDLRDNNAGVQPCGTKDLLNEATGLNWDSSGFQIRPQWTSCFLSRPYLPGTRTYWTTPAWLCRPSRPRGPRRGSISTTGVSVFISKCSSRWHGRRGRACQRVKCFSFSSLTHCNPYKR